MRQVITGVAWWFILTSPVIGYAVYELVRHPYRHPDIGPHGGVIVEWDASHETVAEVVIDRQCGILTVYVLDPWAKRSRDLQTRSITLTLDAPKPMVLKLVSVPRGWYQPDWASQFSSGRVLEPGNRSEFIGTLRLVTNGRQYTGHFTTDEGRR